MGKTYTLSNRYFEMAEALIPGGVNSPVRACKSVDCDPIFIEKAKGAYIYDVDGNQYIDFVSSWGPMILGHCHPHVESAVKEALQLGTSFGIPTWNEVKLAQMIIDMVPGIHQVRLVNSGTEATMSAIRLARAYTGKKKILKFDGCYHGHGDSFLVKAGSGLATLGIPASPGVPEEVTQNTISIPFNDLKLLKQTLDQEEDYIAAVIVEPVPANMGVVLPNEDFLPTLRQWTQDMGIVLIFDEVITGFRLSPGGAQEYFGIIPDLTCLGKIIGGGLPVGAYGGKKEIMDMVAPSGPVYQAGTLSGNPLATAAGIATLEVLNRPGFYAHLEEKAAFYEEELNKLAAKYGINCRIQRIASMLTGFFGHKSDDIINDFTAALKSDTAMYSRFFRCMLISGVYLAPSQFEASFISLAHTYEDIEKTIKITEEAFRRW
jgi:glutamate-1-semialdehyde 2,1-aminomutase